MKSLTLSLSRRSAILSFHHVVCHFRWLSKTSDCPPFCWLSKLQQRLVRPAVDDSLSVSHGCNSKEAYFPATLPLSHEYFFFLKKFVNTLKVSKKSWWKPPFMVKPLFHLSLAIYLGPWEGVLVYAISIVSFSFSNKCASSLSHRWERVLVESNTQF